MPSTVSKKVGYTPLQIGMERAVKQLRGELGYSQEEFAWRAELDRSYVADIERGHRNPTLRSVGLLAKGFDVSILSLFTLACRLSGDVLVRSATVEVKTCRHSRRRLLSS